MSICTLQAEALTTTHFPLLVGGTPEHEKLCRARDQCREILKFVNEAVKQTENRHRLESYQKRLDATALERAINPLAAEFKVGGGGYNTGSLLGPSEEQNSSQGPVSLRSKIHGLPVIGWHGQALEGTPY